MTYHVDSQDPLETSNSERQTSNEENGFVDWASAFKKKPGMLIYILFLLNMKTVVQLYYS